MFFGTYLLKEKVITYDEFIDCVSEQVKSSPTLIEVLFKKNVINEGQMVELIDLQYDTQKNLRELILEKKILTISELDKVIKDGIEDQTSFSDVLVKKEKVSLDELKKHYLEYEKHPKELVSAVSSEEVSISSAALESLKELDGVDLSEFENTEPVIDSKEEDDSMVLSEAALESLRELDPNAADGLVPTTEQKIDSSQSSSPNDTFKQEFLETFSEKMYIKIKKIIVIIHKTAEEDGDFSNFFNSLFREFHLIKGAARLAGYKMFEDLVDQFEEVLESFFKLDQGTKKEWLKDRSDSLNEFIESCWQLRTELEVSGGEDSLDYGVSRSHINNLGNFQLAS